MFPVTKKSVEQSLQKQSPTQVYTSLLQAQETDNEDRKLGRSFWKYLGVGLCLGGVAALMSSPRAGVVSMLLGVGAWYFGTRANQPRNDV